MDTKAVLLDLAVQYQIPEAQVEHVVATAESIHQRLTSTSHDDPLINSHESQEFISGAFVDGRGLYPHISETLTPYELVNFAFAKALVDLAIPIEVASLGLSKPFADSSSSTDSSTRSVGKGVLDSVSETDSTYNDIMLVKDDYAFPIDDMAISRLQSNADSVSATDSITAINFSDVSADGAITDPAGVDDDPQLGIGKLFSDSASESDSGLLLISNYAFDYFAEDYVGTLYTF